MYQIDHQKSYKWPVETWGLRGAVNPQIFAKFDLLPVHNISEKKKVAKEL